MTDLTRVEALHRRLVNERRRIVHVAADAGMLPPAGLLAYLSDVDSAIVAVEAVLEERIGLETSLVIVNDVATHLQPSFG